MCKVRGDHDYLEGSKKTKLVGWGTKNNTKTGVVKEKTVNVAEVRPCQAL